MMKSPCSKQKGIALILFVITALTAVGGAFFIAANKFRNSDIHTDKVTFAALAGAKQSLIDFSLSYQPAGLAVELGRLPYPDRFLDGDYDGQSDCINYNAPFDLTLVIGRFPWLREQGACPVHDINFDLTDAAGERLWYAVSPHLVRHQNNQTFSPNFLDPAVANQWLTLYDENGLVSNRVAFIVFSAGEALPGQNKNNSAPANFLDTYNVPGFGVINNFDNDLTFVKAPQDEDFNDKLIYMTIDEFMPHLERRVLSEVRTLLSTFQTTNDFYPYPALLGDTNYNCDNLLLAGGAVGGGFIATNNAGPNTCPPPVGGGPATIALGGHLLRWQPYIIYEPRQDCIDINTAGCGNRVNGLVLDGATNRDIVLMSPGLYALPSTNNRANYLEDAVNIVDDQTYVTPDPQISNDQLISQ